MTFDSHWQRLLTSNPALRTAERLTITVAELRRLLEAAHKAGEDNGGVGDLFGKMFGGR